MRSDLDVRKPMQVVLAVVALIAALTVPIAVIGVVPAGATTANANDDASFRAAFANVNVDVINLTSDIGMFCASGTFIRNNDTDLVINGNGFKIDATSCAAQTLRIQGSGETTFNKTIITGGNYSFNGAVGGGGMQSSGNLVFVDSTVRDNTVTNTSVGAAYATGGGIFTTGSKSVTLINSTVSGNTATCASCTIGAFGGGIDTGTLTLVNSTVTGNAATSPSAPNSQGGGIIAQTMTIAYSTVVSNNATEGGNIRGGTLTAFGSVVALAVAGGNCSGVTLTSEGYNYEDANTCGFGATGDVSNGSNPGLGALGSNGGATQTRLPTVTSPLVEKIPAADCNDGTAAAGIGTDQRRIPRPRGRGCDIGAVERPAGRFVAVDPVRILDTRPAPLNTGGLVTLGPGETRDLQVTGAGPVPATGVAAVLMNVTTTNAAAAGWLTLFPADTTLPTASNLNFSAGQTVPNLVTVQVASDDGKVSINNSGGLAGAGSVDVIADVVGYYYDATQPSPGDVGFFPLTTPVRILDTRINVGLAGAFGAQDVRTLDVDGSSPPAGVPADAAAVVMNVTATAPSAPGWLTLFPANLGSPPTASNLNFTAGQTVPNLVTVKLSGGDVKIANTFGNAAAGTVHVVADVVGYYRDDYTGGTLVPRAPQRILDTRPVPLNTGGVTGPVAGGDTIQANPALLLDDPPSFRAVVVNVTATGPTKAGWLTIFSSDDVSAPTASNLNFGAGQTVPNLVVAKLGTNGRFKITNSAGLTSPGTVHVVADLVGAFTFNGSL